MAKRKTKTDWRYICCGASVLGAGVWILLGPIVLTFAGLTFGKNGDPLTPERLLTYLIWLGGFLLSLTVAVLTSDSN